MIKKLIFKAFLTIVIFFLIAELILRLFYFEKLSPDKYPLIYKPDSDIGYRYIPNSSGELRKPGLGFKSFKINNQGFYTRDFDTIKDKNTFRIILAGSSVAGGLWMKGSINYSMEVQRLFDSSGIKVEFLNCAIDGANRSVINLKLIQKELSKFNPDLVLFDFEFPLHYQLESRDIYKGKVIVYSPQHEDSRCFMESVVDAAENDMKFIKFLYDHSFVARAACHQYITKYSGGRPSATLYCKVTDGNIGPIGPFDNNEIVFDTTSSLSLLKATRDSLAKVNSAFILLDYKGDKKMSWLLKSNHLSHLFLRCTFDNSCISLPDSHLNEKGHKMVADKLFAALTNPNIPIYKSIIKYRLK